MKIKRLLLGIISSLLFTAGFVRAANQLDPISLDLAGTTGSVAVGAPDCASDCGSMCDADLE